MEVVEEFLRLRREGRGEEAYAMMAPGAAFGCPWGGVHCGSRVHDVLVAEARFQRKGYLDPVKIVPIDDRTFQRTFKWDRGVTESGNLGSGWLGFWPTWKELYFVEDGRIKLVVAERQLRVRSFTHLLGFGSYV